MRRFVPAAALLAGLALSTCDDDEGPAAPDEEPSVWPGYRVIDVLGETGEQPGQLRTPLGLDVDGEGRLWVADTGNRRVQVFEPGGEVRVLAEGWVRPVDVAASDGRVWVADLGADALRCLTADGSPCAREPVRMPAPAGLGARERGGPLAAQLYGHRVVSLHGAPQLSVGGEGSRTGQLYHPTDVAALPGGGFLVADAYNHRLARYDARGRAEDAWPGPPEAPFRVPTGVDVEEGVVHVADAGARKVIALSTRGEVLAEWRLDNDREPRIRSPVRVAAHEDRVYVADPANDRVIVLARE